MWSISIYSGDSPFDLTESDPVLTRDDVTDIRAEFVADPFMLRRGDTWYMFFEVMNAENQTGEIALATSNRALEWSYVRIVLKEPFHLSYPHVFESNGEYFMLPETLGAGSVSLYKAADFPFGWTRVARLIEGQFADPTIVRFNNLWWLFTCSTPYQHDTLRLYFARELTGPWTAHRLNPLIRNDMHRARPAGRLITVNNRLFRFAQDCVPQYGSSVRAFEILELTPDSYREVEIDRSPILKATGNGWNAAGMHHIDAHQQADGKWLACVDGTR